MRPRRLQLEGFSAYRSPVEIDFEGVDLFALTGPTGVGKTAILDAIAFALYGVVHRLGDKKAVAPAISQGRQEARVRLDFTVADQSWTAMRVVRRTKGGGATTAEARLEGPGGVVAGTAEEVSARVTELLGLTYDHFTRCVVLPQGEFARFLHDKPSDRQDLLVSLLELGIYGRMAERAGQRAREAKLELANLDGRLHELAGAGVEGVAEAAARVASLDSLLAFVDAESPGIDDLARQEAEQRRVAEQARAEADLLAAVAVPPDVAGLAAAQAAAGEALTTARASLGDAEAALAEAEVSAAELPDRASVQAAVAAIDELDAAVARRDTGEGVVAELRDSLDAAGRALDDADRGLAQARTDHERANAHHRAHAVRADLTVGEPCPVCEQQVVTLPGDDVPADLDAARAALGTAEAARVAAERARSEAEAKLARAEATLGGVVEQIAGLEATVAGRERVALEGQLAAVDAAAGRIHAATDAARASRQAERDAASTAERAAEAVVEARHRFDVARDGVAALGPPARLGGDLAGEWKALADWAHAEAPARRQQADDASSGVVALAGHAAAAREALDRRCTDAGVAVPRGRSHRDAVVQAQATARARHESLVAQQAEAAKVEASRDDVQARHDLARSLATHLDAKHFEQWLLGEAVAALAAGATELLHSLSGGHYSLSVDGRGNFVVIDHHNADEVRSARTLSGGETFLASLALALALADRIAALASGGAARLDAIFLDEGFGTLDPDTLDVVASAVEELGAAGRMVGVVSHVAELAERVPVRFEVARSGNTATVTRVER